MWRILLACSLCAFAISAHAADYYWVDGANPTLESRRSDSPIGTCQKIREANVAATGQSYTITSVVRITDTKYVCYYKRGTYNGNWSADRRGSSCPAGTVYTPTVTDGSSQCVPEDPTPDCSSKKDEEYPFSKSGAAPDNYVSLIQLVPGGAYSVSAKTEGCMSGCAVSTADQKCVARTNGLYRCAGTARNLGVACPANTTDTVGVEETRTDPDPQTIKEGEECTYVTQPDGTKTCSSSNFVEKEGQHCGEYNGKRICVDTQPTKNGISVVTTVKSETGTDNKTTVTKTDEATKTTCTAVNTCTSTKTTSVTTTVTDANGKTTTSSKCEGELCPKGGGIDRCTDDNCTDDSGFEHNGEDVPGFGESLSDYYSRLKGAPLFAAVAGVTVGSGSCSMGSVSTMVGNVDLDVICSKSSWLDSLYPVMLALWGFAAIRVFLSA